LPAAYLRQAFKGSCNHADGRANRQVNRDLSGEPSVVTWALPEPVTIGGVPASAISARKLIKRLCKQDRKKFTTTEEGGRMTP